MSSRKQCLLLLSVITINVAYGQWVFDNSCTTPNGEQAQCVSINSCPLLHDIIYSQNREKQRFLRESECGSSEYEPTVCCGTTDSYSSATTQRNSRDRSDNGRANSFTTQRRTERQRGNNRNNEISNDLLPDRSSCGFQATDRILDGEQTQLSEFPWMALIQYRRKSGRGTTFACGGTLISKRYVLTAAHCVTGKITEKVGKLHRVRLGEWNTETDVDCDNVKGYRDCNERPVDLEIEETIVHSDYDGDNMNRYNDIALLRLSRDVGFTDFIKPICLPSTRDSSSVGDRLVVAGWGRTEYANSSPVKLKLKVPVVAATRCSSRFRTAGVSISDTQLCAGGEQGRDSCNGDSGGPLMNTFTNDSGQWYIEGIVSFGARCGSQGWPGIYTRVQEFLPWIRENVKS